MTIIESQSIRVAALSDLDAIHQLEEACFSDPWDRNAVYSALTLSHMRTWVMERGEGGERELVGYLILLMLGEEAEVAGLAVSAARRGAGLGGQLLDFATSELQGTGVRTLFLEVRESNSAARGLYASRGFREVGRRRKYYRYPVEDALLLRRDLGST